MQHCWLYDSSCWSFKPAFYLIFFCFVYFSTLLCNGRRNWIFFRNRIYGGMTTAFPLSARLTFVCHIVAHQWQRAAEFPENRTQNKLFYLTNAKSLLASSFLTPITIFAITFPTLKVEPRVWEDRWLFNCREATRRTGTCCRRLWNTAGRLAAYLLLSGLQWNQLSVLPSASRTRLGVSALEAYQQFRWWMLCGETPREERRGKCLWIAFFELCK